MAWPLGDVPDTRLDGCAWQPEVLARMSRTEGEMRLTGTVRGVYSDGVGLVLPQHGIVPVKEYGRSSLDTVPVDVGDPGHLWQKLRGVMMTAAVKLEQDGTGIVPQRTINLLGVCNIEQPLEVDFTPWPDNGTAVPVRRTGHVTAMMTDIVRARLGYIVDLQLPRRPGQAGRARLHCGPEALERQGDFHTIEPLAVGSIIRADVTQDPRSPRDLLLADGSPMHVLRPAVITTAAP